MSESKTGMLQKAYSGSDKCKTIWESLLYEV